ncbi:zinc finger CCCH domain-containing protein 32-like [Impatiens glandulifera]|uniref:zinc finger CCCH domain-containing protein 32-like n=1 Tax=Impatiens glandulifera TaxID=253017 RepID=UPI001FB1894A|nr:zinc finger CCCH domain-containing protein 32-like [Impatiens glandulifera]
MDEEFLKQNIDCVYFLASPYTCKKGVDCEYRHSEIARLNPRDCWYWLAGNCLNPDCAFRHPPLDVHAEGSSESHPSSYSNKVNIPCYFFFNGTCSKGDQCYFLHGPDDGRSVWKLSQTASAVTDAITLQNKVFHLTDSGSSLTDTRVNYPFESRVIPKEEDVHLSVHEKNEEAATKRSQNEGYYACDNQIQGDIEPEDWLDSSSGFDVLLENASENTDQYEDVLERDGRELSSQYLGYDYENHVEYDPEYPDLGNFHEYKIRDSSDQLEDGYDIEYAYIRENPGRRTMANTVFPCKRKLLCLEYAIDDRRAVDLRELIERRREINGRSITCFPRGGKSTYFSHRNYYKMKRQSIQQSRLSEVSRKPVLKKRRIVEKSNRFSRPKMHEQIKKGKRKYRGKGGAFRGAVNDSNRIASEEFEGPKRLCEILNDKKRLMSVVESNT